MSKSNYGDACEAVIRSSIRITPDDSEEVREIVLHVSDPSFRFQSGQSIGVLVPGPHALGNQFHHRRYSIALPKDPKVAEAGDITILVRRCFYNDEISGERYPGIASNFLCDAQPGDTLQLTGPYRSPYPIPTDRSSNLLMIGTGTGIAPFRAFIEQIFHDVQGWEGKVRLFYGSQSGIDHLYFNNESGDLSNYYAASTFRAFSAISDRPVTNPETGVEELLEQHAAEAWSMIQDKKTYLFLGGTGRVADILEKTMAKVAGSEQAWLEAKQKMIDEKRWSELLYY